MHPIFDVYNVDFTVVEAKSIENVQQCFDIQYFSFLKASYFCNDPKDAPKKHSCSKRFLVSRIELI